MSEPKPTEPPADGGIRGGSRVTKIIIIVVNYLSLVLFACGVAFVLYVLTERNTILDFTHIKQIYYSTLTIWHAGLCTTGCLLLLSCMLAAINTTHWIHFILGGIAVVLLLLGMVFKFEQNLIDPNSFHQVIGLGCAIFLLVMIVLLILFFAEVTCISPGHMRAVHAICGLIALIFAILAYTDRFQNIGVSSICTTSELVFLYISALVPFTWCFIIITIISLQNYSNK